MTRPWLNLPAAGLPVRDAIASATPVLQTERLTMRAPRLEDWQVLEPCWTTARAKFIGGPFGEEDAYFDFCQATASWLLRGFGGFVVTTKGDDTPLGLVGVFHDYGDPEAEIGWILTAEAEGQGYAVEAAKAVRTWARDLGFATLAGYIDPENAPSIRAPLAFMAAGSSILLRHKPPLAS